MKKRELKNKRFDKVMLIDWTDASSNNGWINEADCKPHILVCQTVGFFVSETEDAICVALNKTNEKGFKPFGDLMSIPKAIIKRQRWLKF